MHRQKNRGLFPFLIFSLLTTVYCLPTTAFASDEAKAILVLHNGRVKSFDSFCRQTLESIAGRERWKKRDAVSVILEAAADRTAVADKPWVLAGNAALREALGLSAKKDHFSYNELGSSLDKVRALMQSAKEKRDAEQAVGTVEREAESLYGRLVTVQDLITGESLRVIPSSDKNGEVWHSPFEHEDGPSARFKGLLRLFAGKKTAEFEAAAAEWNRWADETTRGLYRDTARLEILYSSARPFQWSWVLYLAAFALLSFPSKNPRLKTAGVSLAAGAMLLHTLGLALRVMILKRPPVSNMYESMVYMNWAVMVFAAAFAMGTRRLVYLSAGAAVSALVMIYGNLLPIDANLEVLVPVLRSNYWLTIHVMTIVSSYGAFGLAMALGHRHLLLELKGKFSKSAQEDSAQLIYRVIQLGVLLLGIGTVLGGVWANESWGRFWGWDPKETWALITFLAYLVVVHLKFFKKIDAHWLAMSSILGFFFVLMTWYGVNFVLGRGLHSYGFGSGGMSWIVYYLVAELAFLGLVLIRPTRA